MSTIYLAQPGDVILKDHAFDDAITVNIDELPKHGAFPTKLYGARFLATIDDADVWAGPHHYAVHYRSGSYVVYSAAMDRDLLPAGPIGDYIHSYRQLIR